jgi:DNA polymerase III epsilon subunit-like protein
MNEQDDEMNRVMIDIETLGTEPGCAVLSVGAVEFCAGGVGSYFETGIDLESCADAGLGIDAATLAWWLRQDEEPRRRALVGGKSLRHALMELCEWLDSGGYDEVWANSPSFDLDILGAAFDAVGHDAPWEYWQERDYRTLRAVSPVEEPPQEGHEHDALADARSQAEGAAAMLAAVGGGD